MIFLYDGSRSCADISEQMGADVERLYSPGSRFSSERDIDRGFAIDNFAFSGFHQESFQSLLLRLEQRRHQCHFVSVPDIVGNARRTLEIFHMVKYHYTTWPLALVCQDGQEDLEIPWRDIKAVFIGGTNRFKLSQAALDIIKSAQILSRWTHVGRINSFDRWEKFAEAGVDSCDGSGFSRFSDAMFAQFKFRKSNLFSGLSQQVASRESTQ